MGRAPSSLRRLLPRRLAARPALARRWLLAGVLALVAAALTVVLLGRAEASRNRWGRTRTVLVAATETRPGEPVRAERRSWPVGLVPEGTVGRLPVGARAAVRLSAGTPLTRGALVTGARRDPARTRQVAVPVPDARLPLRRGARVDVWARLAADRSLGGEVAETRRVARAAEVVSVRERAVVLAVRTGEVPAMVDAAGSDLVLAGVP